ncbi:DUF952 domain-containing protein [Roseobacter sp. HKCCA0434]|uniref:DUF952 domain-containing protein n=1 Tax=Roseobacter sp. HKCCA0434 TaxID=3079297 RepID=UPI002905EE6D|nr:DUF952 domain-containing protein [Roseobacter sp. HKCCA0434]
MRIYKIFRSHEWETLQRDGMTLGAPVDVADGYIHFSTAETVRETAAKHFAGEDDLILAWADSDSFGDDLKFEESRGGALFPHLYRSLRADEIAGHAALPLVAGVHQFPETLP